jgi:2'-5' RNA ligase
MNKRSTDDQESSSGWGSFALVTYLPDPLGSFLTELRHHVPGPDHTVAHITFLPPRALSLPVEDASREIRQRLASVKAFEVELGEVKVFPDTGILYLALRGGEEALLILHGLLNQGGLFAQENFEFTPHLTLGGPLLPNELSATCQQVQQAWKAADLSCRFVVSEVVLLWQPEISSGRDWTRMSSYPLL